MFLGMVAGGLESGKPGGEELLLPGSPARLQAEGPAASLLLLQGLQPQEGCAGVSRAGGCAGAPQKTQKWRGDSPICVSGYAGMGGACKGSVAGHWCQQHDLKTPGWSHPAARNGQGMLCCPGVCAQGDLGFETPRGGTSP